MEYCLDSNIFIQAKNFHYQFDVCPGFWIWLDQENGSIGSITQVLDELQQGNDELSAWAEVKKESGFFTEAIDVDVQRKFTDISIYVTENYKPSAASQFLSGADPWLIAFASVHECTLVTHESYNPSSKRKVLIPNICIEFGISYTDCYTMLKNKGACFVLKQ